MLYQQKARKGTKLLSAFNNKTIPRLKFKKALRIIWFLSNSLWNSSDRPEIGSQCGPEKNWEENNAGLGIKTEGNGRNSLGGEIQWFLTDFRKIYSMKIVQITANCRYVMYILQKLFYKILNMRKDEY